MKGVFRGASWWPALAVLPLVLAACGPVGTERAGNVPGLVHMDLGITYLVQKPGVEGVVVTDVTPGGPAERGGLEVGDVILTFDGTPIDGDHRLLELLADCPEGAPMTVEIEREGCMATLELPAA